MKKLLVPVTVNISVTRVSQLMVVMFKERRYIC